MGFCSRILPGAVYSLLVGNYSMKAVSVYLTVLYFAFVFLLSFLIEKFLQAFPDNPKTCLVLVVLFLTGPFTIEIFFKEFGMLDFHWALLFIISCFFLHNKYLKYLIPVTVALMIFTHYGALVCYVAAILLLILFYCTKAETGRERVSYLIVFFCSLFVGLGFTVYFMMNDTNNLTYTLEEFNDILINERNLPHRPLTFYYDYYFYKHIVEGLPQQIQDSLSAAMHEPSGLSGLIESVLYQIKTTFSFGSTSKFLLINLSGIPLLCFLGYILYSYFKETPHLFKRFLTLLFFALACIVNTVGIFFSTDNTRWLAHSFIILFAFVFYVLYFDYGTGIKKIQYLLSKVPDWGLAVLLFFYASTVVDPYTFSFAFMK